LLQHANSSDGVEVEFNFTKSAQERNAENVVFIRWFLGNWESRQAQAEKWGVGE
jgi:hypothetical protein